MRVTRALPLHMAFMQPLAGALWNLELKLLVLLLPYGTARCRGVGPNS